MRRFTALGLALLSAACFGTSGSLATTLIAAGWTAGAAVTARVGLAALVLTVPAVLQLRGRWGLVRRNVVNSLVYGVVAVAGAQLCFFNAIEHLSVAVAILLEYSGVLLVVGWVWIRHGQRPRRLTVLGTVTAAIGLVLVLNLLAAGRVDAAGVLWGFGAAVGLATYYVLSARTTDALPPLAVAWTGLSIGGVTLLVAGGFGVLALHAPRVEVTVRGAQLAWWLPVAGLALVAAALAYAAGVAGARRLGPKVASFVGLSEVLFASIFAWLLLGQRLGAEQIAGGLLVIAGIALVRLDERAPAAGAPAPTRPEASPLAMAACRRLAEPAWVGDGAEGRP